MDGRSGTSEYHGEDFVDRMAFLVAQWPWLLLMVECLAVGTIFACHVFAQAADADVRALALAALLPAKVANGAIMIVTIIAVVSPRFIQALTYRITRTQPLHVCRPAAKRTEAPAATPARTPSAPAPAKPTPAPAKPTPAPAKPAAPLARAAPAKVPLTVEGIRTRIDRCLHGLVGLDDLSFHLSHKLLNFLKGASSDGILVWGDASTGKTEISNRLCGKRAGIPGVNLEGVATHYVVGIDGDIDIGKLVQSLPDDCIVFMDEMDKVVDPGAQVVAREQARRLAHSLVNHFDSKKVLWVLLGNFEETRRANGGVLSQEVLATTLGTELATRMDFRDWQLPEWRLETLLQAAYEMMPRHTQAALFDGREPYDTEGLLYLAEYCLKHRGGVRLMQKIHDGLCRHVQRDGVAKSQITKAVVEEYLGPRRRVA